jgi:fatty-acyl-CoA synthase
MRATERLAGTLHSARVLARTGVLHATRPGRLAHAIGAARHWGPSLGGLVAATGARYDDRIAIIDERGTVTFSQLDIRTDALARGLESSGIRSSDTVGVLCRNHRYFVEATVALAKLGADILFLNTGFSGPQLREVMRREEAVALIHDEEFGDIAKDADVPARFVAWSDHTGFQLDALADAHASGPVPPRPPRESRTIILTSGTTGPPKGAAQSHTDDTSGIALLDRIPYHARETMVVAAPCFHSWGLANTIVGLLLGNTLVLARRFDPERTLELIAVHRANVLVAVPVMLLRIVDLPAETRARYDTSSLRFVPLSGSALPGDLATRFMDQFGEVIYNLYGSTEVGAVSVATPEDLRAAPGTAGRPPRGVDVRLLDDHNSEAAPGATGRIFVRSPLVFDGYTDGNSKSVIDGFMQTGDTGHFDVNGRLFVDGRDDDMIVSGGENVFPGEVEDVLAAHPDVVEAAVVGVPDEEFGQRLKAFIVRRPDATIDTESLRHYVRVHLANYKVPREIEFVAELPRNATGKLVKRHLS